MVTQLVLVKHALPVLDASTPARHWRLGPEGEAQARGLAQKLETRMPFRLACSSEPKAMRTAEIVAAHLGVPPAIVEPRLDEFDRPPLPLMPREEHERLNQPIFRDLDAVYLGKESGAGALARFTAGLDAALDACTAQTLVVVTHGTVMSLWVAAHNDIDAFALWKRLPCASFVVLARPGCRFLRLETLDE